MSEDMLWSDQTFRRLSNPILRNGTDLQVVNYRDDLILPSSLRLCEVRRRTLEARYTCNVINSLMGGPDSDARRLTELSFLG